MKADIFFGHFEFKDLGRNKAHVFAEIKNEDAFWKVIKKFLMSEDISYVFDEATNEGDIFVGGFRNVGTFVRRPEPPPVSR